MEKLENLLRDIIRLKFCYIAYGQMNLLYGMADT